MQETRAEEAQKNLHFKRLTKPPGQCYNVHTGILIHRPDRSSGLVDGLHLGDLKLVYCKSIYICQTKPDTKILYI